MSENKVRINTTVVHAGNDTTKYYGAISTPIHQVSTFAFPDADQGSAIHEGHQPGYFYGRISNPTQAALETALCALEGGEAALALSSGMAAVANCLLTLLQPGDHVIAPQSLYASTGQLLKFLQGLTGIETTFVDATRTEAYAAAIRPNTKVLYLESPANPTLQLCDISAVVALARAHQCTTVMDNTFASPINQNPIQFGVDLVLHSLTKYLGGHSDILGGAIIGPADVLHDCRWKTNKLIGSVIAPQSAWLVHRGIKTLALRMERHNENAMAVATFLQEHPKVVRVHYPGLESHPQHVLAKKQMRGFGGMIAFEVAGAEAGKHLVNNLRLCTLAVSLGDVATLIQHSASMTHASVPREMRVKAGISDGLIRLSVGIEDVEDIIADLKTGLTAI
jgi:methionine-gamma-lyase